MGASAKISRLLQRPPLTDARSCGSGAAGKFRRDILPLHHHRRTTRPAIHPSAAVANPPAFNVEAEQNLKSPIIAEAAPMAIPAVAHFCWIGRSVSWASAFAVLSAAECGDLAEVILHHTDPLEDCPATRALTHDQRIRLDQVDPIEVLARAGDVLGPGTGEALAAMYRRLDSPVVRSDMLRSALLLTQGGVYLDLDTITARSLLPLLDAPFFLGWEYVVWPGAARRGRNLMRWFRQIGLDVIRKILRRAPSGWRAFRLIQGLYFRNVNNAVMGAEAGAPLLAAYLLAMLDVPPECQALPYVLGPDLLQVVIEGAPYGSVIIHPPETFSPLPPEISEHWFRIGRKASLMPVLVDGSRVVHWYASIHTRALVANVSPSYVHKNCRLQLYSALVHATIGHLPQLLPVPMRDANGHGSTGPADKLSRSAFQLG
jgi:hypothetical protein